MKRGTPKHPKVYALCRLLKVKRPTAIGYLEMLWHMCAEYTPQGDIGKYSDEWIEAALDWTGKRGRLIDCLVEAGWLDREPATTKEPVGNGEASTKESVGNRKLMVHHWHDHAEDSVRKRLNRAGLQFLTVSGKVTGQSPVTDRTLSDTGAGLPQPQPEPQPLPEPQPPPPTSGRRRNKTAVVAVAVASATEFPLTAAALRRAFPDCSDAFVSRLVGEVESKASGHVKESVPDQMIADAVEACHHQGQRSAGLFLKTVPQCVATWVTQGREKSKPVQSSGKSPTVDELAQSIEAFRRTR